MSFIAVGGAALTTLGGGSMLAGGLTALSGISSLGSSLYKGFSAMGNKSNVEAGQAAALDIYNEKLGLLGERRDVAGQATELGYDVAQSQVAAGQRDVGMGAQTGLRDIGASSDVARAQSGLATSGTIEGKVKTQTGDLMAKYKSDMTKLFETREFAGRERAMGLAEADLSFRSGKISAEDAYQNTKTGLESQPTGFLEGMFS